MKVGYLVSGGGRFYASEQDLKRLLGSERGIDWDMALNDGWMDPNYCRGKLKLTKHQKGLVEGTLVYNGKPRKFSGRAEGEPHKGGNQPWQKALAGKTEYVFKFTEPAAQY